MVMKMVIKWSSNGHENGNENDHDNGHKNGHENGHKNGHKNSHKNGHENRDGNGHENDQNQIKISLFGGQETFCHLAMGIASRTLLGLVSLPFVLAEVWA